MTTESAVSPCRVCGEMTEPHTTSICDACGLVFHLNSRMDMPGKDCGEVWVNEEHQALEFACNACLAPPEPAELNDIIDVVEASQIAGLPEAMLTAAVAAGDLPAKRIAGDVLIFQRRDVLEFAARKA